jgi:hypothetical protein
MCDQHNTKRNNVTDQPVEAANSECPKHVARRVTQIHPRNESHGEEGQAPCSFLNPDRSSRKPHRNRATTREKEQWVKDKLPHLTRHGLLSLRRQGLLRVDLAARQHRHHEVLHQLLHRVLQLHHLLAATGAAAFFLHHRNPSSVPRRL